MSEITLRDIYQLLKEERVLAGTWPCLRCGHGDKFHHERRGVLGGYMDIIEECRVTSKHRKTVECGCRTYVPYERKEDLDHREKLRSVALTKLTQEERDVLIGKAAQPPGQTV